MNTSADDAASLMMHNGLALYSIGTGAPLFLMPYPHGFGRAPIVQEPLAGVLRELNQHVLSFDPPGMFNTTRPAQVSMPEMLGCAAETLQALNVSEPLTLVGHSMGGFCALAFALAQPERIKQLILIGSLASASAIQRQRGLPWGQWLTGRDRLRYIYWGFRLSWGLGGTLALHKKMQQLLTWASYADKRLVPHVAIKPADDHCPAPIRDVWPRTVFAHRLNYRDRLKEIHAPTLICVGRYDPQAPVGCSEELANGIPNARLAIFEHSGHYPFIEERDRFEQTVAEFLA
jgi:pimeloyl-ACP methyl ester carboxylesterase